jgi:hypothetical protein
MELPAHILEAIIKRFAIPNATVLYKSYTIDTRDMSGVEEICDVRYYYEFKIDDDAIMSRFYGNMAYAVKCFVQNYFGLEINVSVIGVKKAALSVPVMLNYKETYITWNF